jgi:penicillin-binding protein A
MIAAFVFVGLAAGYWAIAGADTILLRDDNPRLVIAEASILRGELVDRNGEVLAETLPNGNGTAARRYRYPETNGALGYFSFFYGAGGAEAAYDDILRGTTLNSSFQDTLAESLLHRPQVGSDVRLTLDLSIQQAAANAMQGQRGAAVVLDVPSGEVLAMVSLPTFDPNTLDTDWDTLRETPGNPFFNRVLQGRYQPGGALETPLLAAALLSGQPLGEPLELAAHPILVDGIQLTCAVRLPEVPLTLREAYAFACPYVRLNIMPDLPGFVALQEDATGEATAPFRLERDNLVETAIGQGNLTVSPLGMALLAAAIANDGNAPQPYALLETRAPGGEWQPVEVIRPTLPVATVNTARQLQDLMRYAVANGAAQNAGRPNIDIGGHASLAYSGEGALSWFIGFATLGGRHSVAVAVVLENSDDPGLAADIGGTTLAAAQRALQTSPAAQD